MSEDELKRKYFEYIFAETTFKNPRDEVFEKMKDGFWFKGEKYLAYKAGFEAGRLTPSAESLPEGSDDE